MATNNSLMVREGHTGLQLNKTGFRGNKESKEMASSVRKWQGIW